ncbi:MAG: tRNA (adenosine(37)-N6)-dimethylallyltransferase MiaA [Bacteroidota bacterium]|nr:tRNA (adenosine(37)-N6)-dimethylallyltransferase MiaA [Bacteroidota bacterium]
MATHKAVQPGVVVSLVGPTASGKTELAIALAQHLGTEIVSADARQVYRGMAIGTAQPTDAERMAANHHLVDFLDPCDLYSAGSFEEDAVPLLSELATTRGAAILAGGSGMYVKAALTGLDALPADLTLRKQLNTQFNTDGLQPLVDRLAQLDPAHVSVMDTSNPQRVIRALEVCLVSGMPFSSFHTGAVKQRPWHVVSIGLDPDRNELRKRIAVRAHAMIAAGWLEETRALLPHRLENALNTLGYKELFEHLDGNLTMNEALERLVTRTRQFAKRQMTWFKKDTTTTWFQYDASNRDVAMRQALDHALKEVERLQGTPLH